MKNLHILEWSLNLRSDKKKKVYPDFSNEINLISPKPDVLFLVETVKGNTTLSIDKYTVVAESSREGNGCSIAILNTRLGSGDIQIIKDVHPMLPGDNTPDFVQVDVSINNTIYNLISFRIRVENKQTEEEYQQRKEQFDNMLDYVKNLPQPIITGDFNNARILGDRNIDYHEIQKQYKGKEQVKGGYYYQKIKYDLLHTANLIMHTPLYGNSFGLNSNDFKKQNISRNHGYLKYEHLVTPKDMNVKNISYNWDFLDTAVAKGDIHKYALDSGGIMKGFPDHAMLLADIEL